MTQTRGTVRSAADERETPGTDRVVALAHETIDRVAETVNTAELGVRSAAARTAEAAKRAQDQAVEAARENLREVRSYIERNPLTAAGVAFAAGALLVAWLRR
jgi:ElaB/YqjD/DUF883 family membrane-anchored ribosome-binding protein